MFKQFAEGTFSVEVKGDFHCGPDHDSPKVFNWEVEICWSDAALDPRGFLLDNMAFRNYFRTLGVTEDSCELMVLKAAKHYWAEVRDRAQTVSVSINVPGLAKITNIQP